MMIRAVRMAFAIFCAAIAVIPSAAQEIQIRSALAVGPLSQGGRYALHRDPLEYRLVRGQWATPKPGDVVDGARGDAGKWRAVEADKDGWFTRAAGGSYLFATVTVDSPRAMLLEATGHGMVYVNGVPRAGDPYEYGYVRLPVGLHAGENSLLFLAGRGRIRAKLLPAPSQLYLDASDATLPDMIRGERLRADGAITLANTTNGVISGLFMDVKGPGLHRTRTAIPPIPPYLMRKVAFRIDGMPIADSAECPIHLSVTGAKSNSAIDVKLRIREPGQTYKRTFLSRIDGSVQYYAINPPRVPLPKGERPALVLTLHGASVEAIGQADAYAPKGWAYLAAPTNRRPYGFDWEDWGRTDALEVLDNAQRDLHTDPRRTYLTGHSMGGHGTWQLGALFPDRFASIGPSAGWISFYSYGGGQKRENPSPVEEILQRSSAASDTLTLAKNYSSESVYILHGSADDNVPPSEARKMNATLAAFHHDFTYFEQPNAGHWWSNTDEPGAACVDWAPMFDTFLRRYLPEPRTVRQVDFVTPNPAISARCRWAAIEQQSRPLIPSTVSIRVDPNLRRFTGTTENVSLLSLDLSMLEPGKPLSVVLDKQTVEASWPVTGTFIWLGRDGDRWIVTSAPGPNAKSSSRSGPFKLALDHHMLFVYGTHGNTEENAQCFAKARFDAETFWYRGNGSVDVVSDKDFDSDRFRDRGVVVYGNADTNSAWAKLLGASPVQVRRGEIVVGGRTFAGDDLAAVFIRPRPDSSVASVAVVAGSGIAGMRLTERLPIFLSGAGFPDCLVLSPEYLTTGSAGVRAAGFFGNDWRIESGDFAFGN